MHIGFLTLLILILKTAIITRGEKTEYHDYLIVCPPSVRSFRKLVSLRDESSWPKGGQLGVEELGRVTHFSRRQQSDPTAAAATTWIGVQRRDPSSVAVV